MNKLKNSIDWPDDRLSFLSNQYNKNTYYEYIHLETASFYISYNMRPFTPTAAGVGSMLADLLSDAQWALPTLIIKSLMALIMGLNRKKNRGNTNQRYNSRNLEYIFHKQKMLAKPLIFLR